MKCPKQGNYHTATISISALSTLVLCSAVNAATMKTGTFTSANSIDVNFSTQLNAHDGETKTIPTTRISNSQVPAPSTQTTPFSPTLPLANDIHGTTGKGSFSITGIFDANNNGIGYNWTISAEVSPGKADNLPVSTTSILSINNTEVGRVTDSGIETTPEPNTVLSLGIIFGFGTLLKVRNK